MNDESKVTVRVGKIIYETTLVKISSYLLSISLLISTISVFVYEVKKNEEDMKTIHIEIKELSNKVASSHDNLQKSIDENFANLKKDQEQDYKDLRNLIEKR